MAAAISPTGSARDVINLGLTKKLELYISEWVLEETERNLKLKAPKAVGYFEKFRESLIANLVKPKLSQVIKVAKIVEPKDAPVVAAAIISNANFLVTYDRKHLLKYKAKIKRHFKIGVVTPDEVVK